MQCLTGSKDDQFLSRNMPLRSSSPPRPVSTRATEIYCPLSMLSQHSSCFSAQYKQHVDCCVLQWLQSHKFQDQDLTCETRNKIYDTTVLAQQWHQNKQYVSKQYISNIA